MADSIFRFAGNYVLEREREKKLYRIHAVYVWHTHFAISMKQTETTLSVFVCVCVYDIKMRDTRT